MELKNCVFLDLDSIDCSDLDFDSIHRVIRLTSFSSTTNDRVIERLNNADIVIVNKVKLDASHFKVLPRLKLICVIATGVNNIDLSGAEAAGIKVCDVPDYGASAVSQHVMMLILALSTRFLEYQEDVRKGAWQSQDQFCLLSHPILELKDKTLGLIGYGHIAKAVENLATGFGMKVIIGESLKPNGGNNVGRVPLPQLYRESDIISLHCPLTEKTRNLISSEQLQAMKPTALLINAARGGIVNEADLLKALKTGWIAGAALDSIETEPPMPDDPLLNSGLSQLIITPHNAWGTREARQRLVEGVANNITAFLSGSPKNLVNNA